MNSWNASGRPPRTFLDGEGNLRLVLEVTLRRGITEAHLRFAIESFDLAIDEVLDTLRTGTAL